MRSSRKSIFAPGLAPIGAICWALIGFGGVQAQADTPLSAIDWLSKSVVTPAALPLAVKPAEPGIVKGGALPADVAVSTLGAASPDAVGILPVEVTGLPRNLWGLGRTDAVIAALNGKPLDGLPALQSLLITLLLAEADAPADAGPDGRLLLARIDRLLSIGALDQARALLDAAGPATSPELFRRSFDVALLTGSEDAACATLQVTPGLSPALPARIFCLARSGDWDAAALTLQTATALSQVSAGEAALLSRFLDPDLFEGDPVAAPPSPITPLVLKLYEGIGEPLSISGLPIAFAHSDLSQSTGWKARIEAGERLAHMGAVAPNMLLGLYTERQPAASGGVWDRVQAFQDFDAALSRGDTDRIAKALPLVWSAMADVELEVPFAALYAEALAKQPLTGDAARLALDIALLSPASERLSAGKGATDVRQSFLVGLAHGDISGRPSPDSMGRAIAPAFLDPQIGPDVIVMLDQLQFGEAALWAMDRIATGVQGDLRGVTEGLALLRHIGLEDIARRTALELMLLERRG